MKDEKQAAIPSTADSDATAKRRLAISFWSFGLLSIGPNSVYNDLELCIAETVERGFSCIRTEGGAGITHDAQGRPRGELEFYPVLPGHDHFTRELQHMTGGRVDLLKRLIELCTVAKRYNVKVILSSWYYLHTFWFTDKNLTAELLGLPPQERFMYFARGLDRILEELKQRGLADTWSIYDLFEQGLVYGDMDLHDPAAYAPVRRFLRRDSVPFQAILSSREGRPPILRNWFRRIWLYRNLDPNAMPELERMLQESLEKRIDEYKQKATDAVEQAVKLRDELLPGIPLMLGEGASYCADHRLRWEERSDAYWEVVEHTARAYREHGLWGAVARTNSGPEDPVWQEYPERLQRVNAVFLGETP